MKGKKILVANWKMHPPTLAEAKRLFERVKKGAARRTVTLIVCPPFIYLNELRGTSKVALGAQNVFFEGDGAHTGEIDPSMLKNLGAKYVIIGHSERRALGEDFPLIQRKTAGALEAGLRVILCIGERERDHEANYLAFLSEELRSALTGISPKQLKNLIIAYEPIWAIGKNAEQAMKPEEVHEMVIYVRKILSELFNRKVAEKVPVLYGGSVEHDNIERLLRIGAADGFLVGHASLDAKQFVEMIQIVDESR